ncbi:hypothetical protein [Spirochaeta lutea]|uniref:Flavodoxin-like domain-containing protein n=1 Tax=Spirochaeta lutea TaxID=1480694 RepID=A0A098R1R8_9SPIO|nr:hypothetical protein [Spirochaeta lutea]KGE73721.1 hypothetical protein DC28_00350 [Spirochaeta lutea]
MRVAVVYYSEKQDEKLKAISHALGKGFEQTGAHTEVIDARIDEAKKLTGFDYIALGLANNGLFNASIPNRLKELLKNSGQLVGKRSFAFIKKKPFFAQKLLSRLMKAMEGEGMFLKYSEIISSPDEAQEIAKRLHI